MNYISLSVGLSASALIGIVFAFLIIYNLGSNAYDSDLILKIQMDSLNTKIDNLENKLNQVNLLNTKIDNLENKSDHERSVNLNIQSTDVRISDLLCKQDGDKHVFVSGRYTSDDYYSRIYFEIAWLDQQGMILDTDHIHISNIKEGQTKFFSTTGPSSEYFESCEIQINLKVRK